MSLPALEINRLVKRYGSRKALDGLNLSVPKGSIFGLVGQNGAGKTTTLALIAGLLTADSGDINLLGDGPFSPYLHTGRLTLLPQDAQLPKHARVKHVLYYLARLQGLSKIDSQKAVTELLEWVSLTDRANARIRTLSHGMVRRLAIAQAFLGTPELVLLDEPTSGLDPKQVVQIRALFMNRKSSQTLVISSHILSEIEAVCDHVAFIENGRTLRQDAIDEITGKKRLITYQFVPGNLPVDQLRNTCEAVTFLFQQDNSGMTAQLHPSAGDTATVNNKILSILIAHNVGILEVHMGNKLENEFLKQV